MFHVFSCEKLFSYTHHLANFGMADEGAGVFGKALDRMDAVKSPPLTDSWCPLPNTPVPKFHVR